MLRRLLRRLVDPWPRETMLADRYPMHEIGRGTYGDLEVRAFGDDTKLVIGSYCSFAKGTKILLGGEHRTDWVTTYPFNVLERRFSHLKGHPRTKGDVVIGSDVWVARDALILSGVHVGSGAVIGAGAVVSRDVGPYAIVAGNPAVEIRKRFDDHVIAELAEVRWWDWPQDRVEGAVPLLQSADVEIFLKAVREGRV